MGTVLIRTFYFHSYGYPEYPDTFELYDLVEDIEETRDLISVDTVTAARLKEELLEALELANRPFTEK